MLKKPICFSYREYVELREAYKDLLEDNQKLMADNRRLRAEKKKLEDRCRIAEADRPAVVYLCDGKACGKDCGLVDCNLTRKIEHARNFEKSEGGYYYEVGDNIAADVKELLAIVKGD